MCQMHNAYMHDVGGVIEDLDVVFQDVKMEGWSEKTTLTRPIFSIAQ